MKGTRGAGDALTVSEKRELAHPNGCWSANADAHFFKTYYEEVGHERYDDI